MLKKDFIKSKRNRGELATTLAITSLLILLIGTIIGSKSTQNLRTKATDTRICSFTAINEIREVQDNGSEKVLENVRNIVWKNSLHDTAPFPGVGPLRTTWDTDLKTWADTHLGFKPVYDEIVARGYADVWVELFSFPQDSYDIVNIFTESCTGQTCRSVRGTRSSQNIANARIDHIRLTCGGKITYGWKWKRKSTITPSPTPPKATPTQPPQRRQDEPTPTVTPTPTSKPTPTTFRRPTRAPESCNQKCDIRTQSNDSCAAGYTCVDECPTGGKLCPQSQRGVCRRSTCPYDKTCLCAVPTNRPTATPPPADGRTPTATPLPVVIPPCFINSKITVLDDKGKPLSVSTVSNKKEEWYITNSKRQISQFDTHSGDTSPLVWQHATIAPNKKTDGYMQSSVFLHELTPRQTKEITNLTLSLDPTYDVIQRKITQHCQQQFDTITGKNIGCKEVNELGDIMQSGSHRGVVTGGNTNTIPGIAVMCNMQIETEYTVKKKPIDTGSLRLNVLLAGEANQNVLFRTGKIDTGKSDSAESGGNPYVNERTKVYLSGHNQYGEEVNLTYVVTGPEMIIDSIPIGQYDIYFTSEVPQVHKVGSDYVYKLDSSTEPNVHKSITINSSQVSTYHILYNFNSYWCKMVDNDKACKNCELENKGPNGTWKGGNNIDTIPAFGPNEVVCCPQKQQYTNGTKSDYIRLIKCELPQCPNVNPFPSDNCGYAGQCASHQRAIIECRDGGEGSLTMLLNHCEDWYSTRTVGGTSYPACAQPTPTPSPTPTPRPTTRPGPGISVTPTPTPIGCGTNMQITATGEVPTPLPGCPILRPGTISISFVTKYKEDNPIVSMNTSWWDIDEHRHSTYNESRKFKTTQIENDKVYVQNVEGLIDRISAINSYSVSAWAYDKNGTELIPEIICGVFGRDGSQTDNNCELQSPNKILFTFDTTKEKAPICQSLDNNNGISIVISGDNYKRGDVGLAELMKDANSIKEAVSQPLGNLSSKLHFVVNITDYFVDNGCGESTFRGLCKKASFLKKRVDCGGDYGMVVSTSSQRMADQGWAGSTSRGSQDTIIAQDFISGAAPHELGHAIARLWDEYSVTSFNGDDIYEKTVLPNCSDKPSVSGSENDACEIWNEKPYKSQIGCYKGCFNPNWYRSSSTSIMSGSFGNLTFNPPSLEAWEGYLNALHPLSFQSLAKDALYHNSLFLELGQDQKSNLSVNKLDLVQSYPDATEIEAKSNYFKVQILDINHSEIFSKKILSKTTYHTDPPPGSSAKAFYSEPIIINPLIVSLPYFSGAREIVFQNESGKQKLRINLADYKLHPASENQNLCGNGICDGPIGENVNSCRQDCQQAAKALKSSDFNSDGTTNTLDYAILLQKYGERSENMNVDLNGDGVVNAIDLSAILELL